MNFQRPPRFTLVSAVTLLTVWVAVMGLEVTHQFGHLVAGCTHHHHHGEHAHHHEGCQDWSGPHEADHIDSHEHQCALCDWMFSPLANPFVHGEDECQLHVWLQRSLGQIEAGHRTPLWATACGRRGPPQAS
ncbi:MAG: hypothetical protein ACPGOX_08950 [Flavobacteriales bacterium]